MKENQNASLDPIDAERLSLSMNDMFITENETGDVSSQPELDDSITAVKSCSNDEQSESQSVNESQGKSATDKDKKSKKSKKQNKNTINEGNNNCVCNGKKSGEMIRCNFCQLWFHLTCVGDDNDNEIGFWVCLECRILPSRIKNVESMLVSFI